MVTVLSAVAARANTQVEAAAAVATTFEVADAVAEVASTAALALDAYDEASDSRGRARELQSVSSDHAVLSADDEERSA